MIFFKMLEDWIRKYNEKAIADFEEKTAARIHALKQDPNPIFVDIIETKSGVQLKFLDEESKQNLFKKISN